MNPLSVNLGRSVAGCIGVMMHYWHSVGGKGDCTPLTQVCFPDGTIHAPMILFSRGGCKKDAEGMFFEGVPEFVIELWDPDAVTYFDFERTLDIYERNGVAEVISNDAYRRLNGSKYEIVTHDENGIIVSDVLDRFHWDMTSFKRNHLGKVMDAIDTGLSNVRTPLSDEHAPAQDG